MEKTNQKYLPFKISTLRSVKFEMSKYGNTILGKNLLELSILFGFQTLDLAMFLAWHITSEWTHSCRFQLEYHLSMPFLNIEKVGNRKKVLITFFFCGFFQVQRKR